MYTIRDIARLADVSTATVSAVMNRKNTVSEKLTRRVLDAMEALDYHPDQVARSLKVRHTQTVGMILADVTNPFFTNVMRGVEDVARAASYSVLFCNSNEDPEIESHHLDTLFARRVDGVLISPTGALAAEERLIKRRFPLVFFDRRPEGFSGPAVVSDNVGSAREAAAHLLELGHTRIAIITGRPDMSTGRDRLEGFRQGLARGGAPLQERYTKVGDFKLESGYQAGLELMRMSVPPTAIFCSNNQMTLGLLRALSELRIPCPKQVSVLGFDDFNWSLCVTPRMTMIAQPAYEMGRKAMEILIEWVERRQEGTDSSAAKPTAGAKDADQDHRVILPNQLLVRESTAPPPR